MDEGVATLPREGVMKRHQKFVAFDAAVAARAGAALMNDGRTVSLAQLSANIKTQATGATLRREEGLKQVPRNGLIHGLAITPNADKSPSALTLAGGHLDRVCLLAGIAVRIVQQIDQHTTQVL